MFNISEMRAKFANRISTCSEHARGCLCVMGAFIEEVRKHINSTHELQQKYKAVDREAFDCIDDGRPCDYPSVTYGSYSLRLLRPDLKRQFWSEFGTASMATALSHLIIRANDAGRFEEAWDLLDHVLHRPLEELKAFLFFNLKYTKAEELLA